MDWFVMGMRYGLVGAGAVIGFMACAGLMMMAVSFIVFLCTWHEVKDDGEAAPAQVEEERWL